MLIKKLDNRVYAFLVRKDCIASGEDTHHCVGMLPVDDELVTEPILADSKYHYVDITNRFNFEEVPNGTVLTENEVKVELDHRNVIRVKSVSLPEYN